MLQTTINNKTDFAVTQQDGQWMINDTPAALDIQVQPNGLISVLLDGKSYTATVEKVDTKAKELVLKIDGQPYTVAIKEPIDQLLSSMGLDLKAMQKIEPVKAPMPGLVLRVLVEPGQQINKGDGLLILEAMKMENVIKAEVDCVVLKVHITKLENVEKNQVLIELDFIG